MGYSIVDQYYISNSVHVLDGWQLQNLIMNSETISACRHIQLNSVIHSLVLNFQVSEAVMPGALKCRQEC